MRRRSSRGSKGLRKVIVRPGLKPHDTVPCLSLRRQEQDGCCDGFTQVPAERDPVLAGHHDIEHDEIKLEP